MGMGVQTEFVQFRMGTIKLIFEHDNPTSYTNDGGINSQSEWA
jgi:hypothetical protein